MKTNKNKTKEQASHQGGLRRRVLLGSAALIALSGSAFAADLPVRTYSQAPAPAYVPAPIYNWTGFYIGGHIGGAWNGGDNIFGTDGRFAGGVQGGYDYQFAPNWVAGVEAEYTWTGGSRTNAAFYPGNFTVTGSSTNAGSVTGRIGYTWGAALLYAKGGLAFRGDNSNLNAFTTSTGLPVWNSTSQSNTGYTLGAGLEYMFAPNWSAKAEYQYYNFGTANVTVPTGSVSWRDDVQTVKAGLNYRFNWGGPPVARY